MRITARWPDGDLRSRAIVVGALLTTFTVRCVADCITGRVTRVSDGDTVWVTDAAKLRHKVRLDRIDAPEKDQPWGKESAAALKRWVFARVVRVEYEKHDRYGRVLGIVYDGTNDVNLAMVRSGNAWHYSHFDKTPAYGAAEIEARAEKRGLWAGESPVNPYEWRRKSKGERR